MSGGGKNFSSRNFTSARSTNMGGNFGGQAGRANFVSRNFSNHGNISTLSHQAGFAGKGNTGFNGGQFSGGKGTHFQHGNWSGQGGNWGNWHGYHHGGNYRGGYGYGGWGSPFWGWGLGWGLGWGWPYYWGWPYSGWGYGGWGGYGYPYGYGLGYGYGGGYGYGYPANSYAYAYDNPNVNATTTPQLPADTQPADQSQSANEFIGQGEQLFKAGQYQEAVRAWQHALVDNPTNGGVLLMVAQALFALGQYEPAANTVQMAMQGLPDKEWGTVVKNYTEIYPQIENYTNQLKALEKARDAKPDDPALRFLLGYHFGFLGYPKHAVRELDKAIDLVPQDVGSQKLREIFAPLAGLPQRVVTPPPPQPDGGQGAPAKPDAAPPQAAPKEGTPTTATAGESGVPA